MIAMSYKTLAMSVCNDLILEKVDLKMHEGNWDIVSLEFAVSEPKNENFITDARSIPATAHKLHAPFNSSAMNYRKSTLTFTPFNCFGINFWK